MDQDLSAVIPRWKECNAQFADRSIASDPEWLQERFRREKANIRVYLLERDAKIVGAIPLEFYRHRLDCHLGDLSMARIPLNMFRILGYTPNMPAEQSAYDLFFERLLAFEFDAIYMTCIKADSFFWQYLHRSGLIRRHFLFYSERGLRSHPYIRIEGSFEDYIQKFSSKTRNNFSRQVRKLRETGDVELVRITEERQVDSFTGAAAEISRKTYQFRVLRIGVRDPEGLKEWLKWAARQGWLRSYLLKCAGIPCAFQIAYQYNRTFLGVEIGHDPAWSKLGVGIIQQLLAVEDLFKQSRPDICDFGAYAHYKQFLANDAYSDALVWLFRRRPYPLLALGTYRLFDAISKTAGAVLDQVNLKSKVRQWLRKQSK